MEKGLLDYLCFKHHFSTFLYSLAVTRFLLKVTLQNSSSAQPGQEVSYSVLSVLLQGSGTETKITNPKPSKIPKLKNVAPIKPKSVIATLTKESSTSNQKEQHPNNLNTDLGRRMHTG